MVDKPNESQRSFRVSKTVTLGPFPSYLAADKRAFVVIPFDEEYAIIFKTIQHACKKEKYVCIKADQIQTSSIHILSKIKLCLKKADIVIIDITKPNANVFFEYGLVHEIKHVILIKGDEQQVPSDIRGLEYIRYENKPEGMRPLEMSLRKYIKNIDDPNIKKSGILKLI